MGRGIIRAMAPDQPSDGRALLAVSPAGCPLLEPGKNLCISRTVTESSKGPTVVVGATASERCPLLGQHPLSNSG